MANLGQERDHVSITEVCNLLSNNTQGALCPPQAHIYACSNPHLRELDSVHTHPRKGCVCPLFLILPKCLYDSGTLLTMPRDSYLRRKSCLQTARLFLGLPGVRKELSPAKHECCVASVHRGRRGMWVQAGPVRVSPAQRHILILQTFHSLLKVSLFPYMFNFSIPLAKATLN